MITDFRLSYYFTLDIQTNALWEDSLEIIGDVSLLRDERDGLPPLCTFTSVHLNELSEPTDIWARALSLLGVYNGARNLYFNPKSESSLMSSVKLKRLYILDEEQDITPSRSYEIVQSPPFADSLITSDFTKGNSSKLSRVIHLSKSNRDILDMLLLLGIELNWVTLYSILDTVKYYSSNRNGKFFDGLLQQIDSGSRKLKAFAGTANNFGLLGVQARHDELGWNAPSMVITLIEAQEFIISLCNEYLKHAYSIQ